MMEPGSKGPAYPHTVSVEALRLHRSSSPVWRSPSATPRLRSSATTSRITAVLPRLSTAVLVHKFSSGALQAVRGLPPSSDDNRHAGALCDSPVEDVPKC